MKSILFWKGIDIVQRQMLALAISHASTSLKWLVTPRACPGYLMRVMRLKGPRESTLEHRELKAIKYQTVWLELEQYVGHDTVLV